MQIGKYKVHHKGPHWLVEDNEGWGAAFPNKWEAVKLARMLCWVAKKPRQKKPPAILREGRREGTLPK